MKPPKGFVNRLKEYEKTLDLAWNPRDERWEVWCYPGNGPGYRVHTIQNEDHTFRKPDNRTFLDIARSDKDKFATSAKHLAFIDNAFNQQEKEKKYAVEQQTEDWADKLIYGIKKDF